MNWQVEFLKDAVKGQLASARDHHASEHADKAYWQGRIDTLEGILKFCAIMDKRERVTLVLDRVAELIDFVAEQNLDCATRQIDGGSASAKYAITTLKPEPAIVG